MDQGVAAGVADLAARPAEARGPERPAEDTELDQGVADLVARLAAAPGPEGLAEDTDPNQGVAAGVVDLAGRPAAAPGPERPAEDMELDQVAAGVADLAAAHLPAAQGAACRLDRVAEPVAAPAGREVVQAAATGWML